MPEKRYTDGDGHVDNVENESAFYFPEVSFLLVVSLLFYQSWCDNQNARPLWCILVPQKKGQIKSIPL